jgi:hypothetical protein
VPKFRQRSVRIGHRWSGSGWSVTVFHLGVITSVDASALISDGAGDHLAIDAPDGYAVEAACCGHFWNSLV